jgi:CHAD domain-containing protein
MPRALARVHDSPPNAARVVAAALRAQWRRTREELAKVRTQRDNAQVHDLRVALRRLVSALDLAAAVRPEVPAKITRQLEDLLRSFSPLRDLEVEKQTLERLGETRPDLLHLAEKLERRRSALAWRLTKKLGAVAPDLIERVLEHYAEMIEGEAHTPHATRILVLASVVRRYAKFDRLRRGIAGGDGHALHDVRVAFKKYRYAIEVALPLLPRQAERELATMKLFQDELGAIQDATVLIETLSRAKQVEREPKQPGSLLGLLKQEQRRRIEAMITALEAQVSADPPAFSDVFG